MPSPYTHHVNVDEIPPDRLQWKMDWIIQGIKRDDPFTSAVAIIFFAGLRPEEVLGLSWGDVSIAEESVHIRRACTHKGLRDAKFAREVHLSWESVWAFENLRDARNASKRRLTAKPSAGEPVFCGTSGCRANRKLFSRWWRTHRDFYYMSNWTLSDLHAAGIRYASTRTEAGC